jgi:hypothetical protein
VNLELFNCKNEMENQKNDDDEFIIIMGRRWGMELMSSNNEGRKF